MKRIMGWMFIIGGIALGIYIGIWFLLIGGIIQIVNNINPVDAIDISIGIVRIVFCAAGWIPAYLGVIVGSTMLDEV